MSEEPVQKKADLTFKANLFSSTIWGVLVAGGTVCASLLFFFFGLQYFGPKISFFEALHYVSPLLNPVSMEVCLVGFVHLFIYGFLVNFGFNSEEKFFWVGLLAFIYVFGLPFGFTLASGDGIGESILVGILYGVTTCAIHFIAQKGLVLGGSSLLPSQNFITKEDLEK